MMMDRSKRTQTLISRLVVLSLLSTLLLNANHSSTAADMRTPRQLNEIPRPAELALGVMQVKYKGYFNDDTGWFSDERVITSEISRTVTLPSGLPVLEWSSNPVEWAKSEKTSYSWTGHFIPDVTGEWQFQISSDDASYMWLGNDAVTNYSTNKATALIQNGGIHAEAAVSAKITLIKDQIYPFRLQYGNDTQASVFKFLFKSPGITQWQSDFSTLLWRAAYSSDQKVCGNFGLSYTLSLELGYGDSGLAEFCKKIGADPNFKHTWINVVEKSKPQVPSITSVKMTSTGLAIEVALGDVKVSSIYLLSPIIGYSNTAKLVGTISNQTASFFIPASKLKNITKIDFNLFSSNESGSTSVSRKAVPVKLPGKTPTATPKAIPKPAVKPKTPAPLVCSKGDKSREFAGKVCPPGWSKS
jgi:hypothetical protein